jgi:hypothetical protein
MRVCAWPGYRRGDVGDSHFRLGEPLLPTIYCPLCTESDLIVARRRNDATSRLRSHALQRIHACTSTKNAHQSLATEQKLRESGVNDLRVQICRPNWATGVLLSLSIPIRQLPEIVVPTTEVRD